MVGHDLSPELLKAGQEYLQALQRLHLDPEGLLWARVNELPSRDDERDTSMTEWGKEGDWHLVLITSAIDEAGPLALQRLLFKAYNHSATPKEISPFIVEVMSSKSPFMEHLVQLFSRLEKPSGMLTMNKHSQLIEGWPTNMKAMVSGLWLDSKWVYQLQGTTVKDRKPWHAWQSFRKSVDALAA